MTWTYSILSGRHLALRLIHGKMKFIWMRELSNVEWSNYILLHDYIAVVACSECLCHRFSTSPLALRASNSDKATSVNYHEFTGMVYNSTPHSPEEGKKID